MNFLKSLWRKLFKVTTGVYDSGFEDHATHVSIHKEIESQMYDPSEDPEKIMTGEIESYFE
jgi:hypothetical protein